MSFAYGPLEEVEDVRLCLDLRAPTSESDEAEVEVEALEDTEEKESVEALPESWFKAFLMERGWRVGHHLRLS